MPPSAGPRIAAGLADAALERHALHRLLARDDLRLEGGEGRSLEAAGDPGDEDDGEDRRAGRARRRARSDDERDRAQRHDQRSVDTTIDAPVAPVGQVAAEEHSDSAGIASTSPSQPSDERVAGDVVDLEADDGDQRADAAGCWSAARRAGRGSRAAGGAVGATSPAKCPRTRDRAAGSPPSTATSTSVPSQWATTESCRACPAREGKRDWSGRRDFEPATSCLGSKHSAN